MTRAHFSVGCPARAVRRRAVAAVIETMASCTRRTPAVFGIRIDCPRLRITITISRVYYATYVLLPFPRLHDNRSGCGSLMDVSLPA